MKSVSALLEIRAKLSRGTPESGVYAALIKEPPVLHAVAPAAAPAAFAGHQAIRRPRQLSAKQRAVFPFLGEALERIKAEAVRREQRWLRRLDSIHASGCRTKQQVWNAVSLLSEPIFARFDVATMCCGWLDEKGVFRLNRQKGLAEDTGLTESRVSRALKALMQAGYISKKVKRIYKHGQRWICRITLQIRPQFFVDLGLGHQLAQARTAARKRRDKQLKDVATRQNQSALNELMARQQRNESHRRAEGKRRMAAQEQARVADFEYAKRRSEVLVELLNQHPDVPHSEIIKALNQRYPLKQ